MSEERKINEAIATVVEKAVRGIMVEVGADAPLDATARASYHHPDNSTVFIDVEHRSGVIRYRSVVTVITDVAR